MRLEEREFWYFGFQI